MSTRNHNSRARLRSAIAIVTLGTLSLNAFVRDSSALGGIEGTFEYALDAPWRIEPVIDAAGQITYGGIPIQITILDENVIPYDAESRYQIGNFCDLVVAHNNGERRFALGELAEIERTGSATTSDRSGSWIHGNAVMPPHATCLPGSQSCTALQSPHGTSEWHATAWYIPDASAGFTPGADLVLTLTANFTRSPQIACTSSRRADFLSLKNYVSVHAGEAPLPRFRDNRWAYGDLHFHGQGTDNEGEAGYNYRGIIRAMGALGLDFVLATEHASDSNQVLDVDWNGFSIDGLRTGDLASRNGKVLRDMDAQRFAFLHRQLWGQGGANKLAAIDGRSSSGAPARPQSVLGHGLAPQIFLGGEVDAMPELGRNFPATGSFVFGNGLTYKLSNLCGGWVTDVLTSCDQSKTVQQREGVTILKDVQGFNAMHPARAHLVYMPRDPTDTNAFVSSRTGILGGGGRQLTRGDGVLPEMENDGGPQKGYAFLAHPVPMGKCAGGAPDLSGGKGPDVVPYSRPMLDQAFRSKAVLGLELWNEDIRMKNAAGTGTAREMGYEASTGSKDHGIRNNAPKGFVTGNFEMYPWARFPEPSYAEACTGTEWMLHHGLKVWDDMLMRGINPAMTSSLSWLPAGEPRRLFIAGGSDAHGDLNFHRSGYMLGLDQVDDMAIGKPRNLVMVGAPEIPLVPAIGAVPGVLAHSQRQVLGALQNGAFSVTDGPALRIAIDRNGDGLIDDGDTPMGEVVEMYGDTTLPLLLEWDSTPEWGPIQQVEIVIGAIKGSEPAHYAMFAPVANGPRSASTPPFSVRRTDAVGGGRNVNRLADGYTEDPTRLRTDDPLAGSMRFFPLSLSGHRKIDISLSSLSVGDKGDDKGVIPDRLYIRAFARSQPMIGNSGRCAPDPKSGKCFLRYAFTNPIWAISPPFPAGTCPTGKTRAIDSDRDGKPNGCDPCPHTKQPTCDGLPADDLRRDGGGVIR
jgi:hypothetical protein